MNARPSSLSIELPSEQFMKDIYFLYDICKYMELKKSIQCPWFDRVLLQK